MNYTIALGDSVSSLQLMLRDFSKLHEDFPSINIDGIFGEETLEAVLLYQRDYFPPVTGIVTKEVWDSLRAELEEKFHRLEKPRPLRAFPENQTALKFGDEQEEIAFYQTMFSLLGRKMEGIRSEPASGLFTQTLRANISWLQEISGIPVTGALDRQTWDRLTRLYEVYITAV